MDGTIGYLSAKTYKKLVLQISSKVTTDSYTKLTFPTFIANLQTLYYLKIKVIMWSNKSIKSWAPDLRSLELLALH